MKNTRYLIIIALLFFQINACKDSADTSTGAREVGSNPISAPCEGKSDVRLIIHDPSGTGFRQIFYVPGGDSENVLFMMNTLKSTDPTFQFETREITGIGAFVESFNGVKNNDEPGKYWMYCVNDSASPVGISERIVQLCDKIEWRYILPKEMPCAKIGEN